MNPSLLSNSLRGRDRILLSGSSQYSDFVTGSDFSPFVTTVGLYDEEQNLLAVGKLSQPLPTSQTTDTTILINLDRWIGYIMKKKLQTYHIFHPTHLGLSTK